MTRRVVHHLRLIVIDELLVVILFIKHLEPHLPLEERLLTLYLIELFQGLLGEVDF